MFIPVRNAYALQNKTKVKKRNMNNLENVKLDEIEIGDCWQRRDVVAQKSNAFWL